MRLQGKNAIVTGASRGIGRAIAIRLAQEGANVVVNYAANADAAQEVAEIIRSLGVQTFVYKADVSKAKEVQAMVQAVLDEFGAIHILVNNAGICPFEDFLNISEELWDRVIEVNLKGYFLCSQFVAKSMIERGIKGRIINISSISSLVGGSKQAHYCASKAGINLLTMSMAIALGPYGITCNAVLPGTIETDINKEDLSDPAKRAYMIKRVPLGRLGVPEDVAGAVVFLASDDASYITGSLLVIDGGMLINLQ